MIATLALCVGAHTAILSVLHGLLLKAMPFPQLASWLPAWRAARVDPMAALRAQ